MQPIVQYAMIYLGHPNPARVFLITSLLTLGATAYIAILLPDSLVRLVLWLIATHSRLSHPRRRPRQYPGNRRRAFRFQPHVVRRRAAADRLAPTAPIRFLIFKDIYDLPFIKPFAKLIRAIPISSELRPREMLQSLRQASEPIRSGEVVCIFAEGQITRIGQLLPFRRGMERIMKGVGRAHHSGKPRRRVGQHFQLRARAISVEDAAPRFRYPVTVSFGKPLPPQRTTFRGARSRAAIADRRVDPPQEPYADAASRPHSHRAPSPFRFAMGDKRRPRMNGPVCC